MVFHCAVSQHSGGGTHSCSWQPEETYGLSTEDPEEEQVLHDEELGAGLLDSEL
jgi:hypothetical protein